MRLSAFNESVRRRQRQKTIKAFRLKLISLSFVFLLVYSAFSYVIPGIDFGEKIEALSSESLLGNNSEPTVTVSTTPTPKIDYISLKQEILDTVDDELEKYGIYVKNLKTGEMIDINGDTVFPPASISKVPVAMLVLRDVDNGVFSLDQTFTLKGWYKQYSTDSMYYKPTNSKHTLRTYLDYLIRYSDNTAMTALEDLLGGVDKINQRSKDELGITTFFRLPHMCTAKEIGRIFEMIYNEDFLSKESNDFLIDLLSNIGEWMQNRIPKGIPEGANVKIAHKIGDITTEFGAEIADAGIIYGEKTDFILVVVNKDIQIESAQNKIIKITETTYKYFEL